jgi:hypothetical protein
MRRCKSKGILGCHPSRAPQTEGTVAFGYPRERVFEQRVSGERPLAIRDMRRLLTAGDGPANKLLDDHSFQKPSASSKPLASASREA